MAPYSATQSILSPKHLYIDLKIPLGGLQSFPHLSQGSSIWLCKANFVEACSGGHVILHPLTSVWQDPNRPDPDMSLTQMCYDAGIENVDDVLRSQKVFDTLFEFSAFCGFLRKFSAFLRKFSAESFFEFGPFRPFFKSSDRIVVLTPFQHQKEKVAWLPHTIYFST